MIIKYYDYKKLYANLKLTTLKGNDSIKPYDKASMSLRDLSISDIMPTSFYYFSDHVNILKQTRGELRKNNLNIFHLNGYVEFEKDNQLLTLTPPIIEIVNGKNLLLDGMHRVMLSHILNQKTIQCVVIENSNPLPYAIENPNGWEDVKEFKNKVPEGFKTRNRRYSDNEYKYYGRVFHFDGTIQIPRKHHQNDDINKLLLKDILSKSR